jgi:hypothetical protein
MIFKTEFRRMAHILPPSIAHPRITEEAMDKGLEFLQSQVNNAVAQHKMLLESLEDHEREAEDLRFRDLCSRHLPNMRSHQRMLEEYQAQLGAREGAGKKAVGALLGGLKDLADVARGDDFLRLVQDIVMARQAEDTAKTFREAGKTLGNEQLARIGEVTERHHDEFVHDANRLVQQMFVERVRGERPAETRVEYETRP